MAGLPDTIAKLGKGCLGAMPLARLEASDVPPALAVALVDCGEIDELATCC